MNVLRSDDQGQKSPMLTSTNQQRQSKILQIYLQIKKNKIN
jgi:hypothetical protein